MNDKSIKVVLGYTVKKIGSQRHFTARAVEGSKTLKTKTISIGHRNEDEAYEELMRCAEELAKLYKCGIQKKTKAKLMAIKPKNETPKTASTTAANPLVEKFGNILQFNALMKHAIKRHGIEKVDEVLQAAAAFVNEVRVEINREATVISAANRRIAQVVIDARKEGVDMAAPNEEIEAVIKILMNNEKRNEKPQKIVGNFAIGNEKWDGKGTAPASFAKYLNENENHSLEDLRV